jgi:hypothetical protein
LTGREKSRASIVVHGVPENVVDYPILRDDVEFSATIHSAGASLDEVV